MVVIYCSTFGLRYFYKVSALLLRNSSPLRTARKDNRKVVLFLFLYGWTVAWQGEPLRGNVPIE